MSATDNMTQTVELPAVDLDDTVSGPAVTIWDKLVRHGDRTTVRIHAEDASTLIEFPRPSWAPADCDAIGSVPARTCYRSDSAAVAASMMTRHVLDDRVTLPRAYVRAKVNQLGQHLVQVSLHQEAPVRALALTFTVDEARHLAGVLRAAAELAGMP